LELTQFDNFVMQSKSGGQIGLACDQVDIDTQSLTLGGYLKAPSQDHLEIGAVTETNLKIGNNSLIKVDTTGIGEFGHATAGQQSDYGALSDGTGGSTSGGLVDVTTGGLADPAKINDNFARIDAKLDAIRAVLRAHGRMA
jgi:hypothetical protein